MNDSVFHKEIVKIQLKAANWESAIQQLGNLLLKNGYIKKTYVKSVIQREREYATGLPTKPIGIAIPHTDCLHVKKTGVAIGVLSKPVQFKVMGSPNNTVNVSLIFLMAIREPNKQVKMLQAMVQCFHNHTLLDQLYRAESSQVLLDLLMTNMDRVNTL